MPHFPLNGEVERVVPSRSFSSRDCLLVWCPLVGAGGMAALVPTEPPALRATGDLPQTKPGSICPRHHDRNFPSFFAAACVCRWLVPEGKLCSVFCLVWKWHLPEEPLNRGDFVLCPFSSGNVISLPQRLLPKGMIPFLMWRLLVARVALFSPFLLPAAPTKHTNSNLKLIHFDMQTTRLVGEVTEGHCSRHFDQVGG